MPTSSSQFLKLNGHRIHYLDQGSGLPILFLHGIPTHSYLWRKILPETAAFSRAIALDWIGFGKSDQPRDIDYSLETYRRSLKEFIDRLELDRLVIVAMDLGLMVAVDYARRHPERLRGLIMMEGLFLPTPVAFRQQSIVSRLILRLLKYRPMAHRALVQDPNAARKMLQGGTVRRLTESELKEHTRTFKPSMLVKKIWLDGIGPYSLQLNGPDSLSDSIALYSQWLQSSSVPKLLLYGEPGQVVTRKTLTYCQDRIKNLETKNVGRGRHFLPEDQPENIKVAIRAFHSRIFSHSETQ